MFCTNCGKKISGGAKFCGNCGTPVLVVEPLDLAVSQVTSVHQVGKLLSELKNVSKYKGTPVAGYSTASGILSVYDNRIEFKKKMGNALSARLGVIGLAAAEGLAQSMPVEVFDLTQISALRVGKYMGIYNTLVITGKNGEIWSFCPVLPNSAEPQKIISLLMPYMQLQDSQEKFETSNEEDV